MDTYYLSENLYIKDDKMYNKKKLIISTNWHKLLKEIGWYKLPTPWIKRLNKMSSIKVKNSPYGVIECGSDGDCFFHCISFALNSIQRYNKDNSRCTCVVDVEEVSIPKDIRDVIDLEPLVENLDISYRDDITDAYEYVRRIKRYNFE